MKNEDKIDSCRHAAQRLAHAAFLLLFLAYGAAHAFIIAPYFPLSAGASWTYQINDSSGTTTVVRTSAGPLFVGAETVELSDSTGDKYSYSNDANGIRQHRVSHPNVFVPGFGTTTATEVDTPPQVLANAETTLGEPVTSGGTVTLTYSGLGTFPLSYLVTSTAQAFETVSVPAGTFSNALRFRTVTRVFGTISGPGGSASVDITQDETDWLVTGIGIIRSTSSTSSITNGVSDGPPEVGTAVLISSNLMDSVPDTFTFNGVVNASLTTVATSNTVTVSGTTIPAAVSVIGGRYSIDGGPFTSTPGTINSGQTISVQVTSAATPATETSATLTIGGVSAIFRVTTQIPLGTSALLLFSQPGDYIGQGQTAAFAAGTQYAVTSCCTFFPRGVTLQISGQGKYWEVDMGGAGGAILTPGIYENTTKFQTTSQPGLFVHDGFHICDSSGRFEVLDASYDAGGALQSFAANFEERCGNVPPGLFGQIRYQSNVPLVYRSGAPTAVTATPGIASATISFSPPADSGGQITSYTVTASPGGNTAIGSAPPVQISGLTGGAPYTFTVTANNAAGPGQASAPSNTVIPAVVPDSTPNAFIFTPVTGALTGRGAISDLITVTGINVASPISIAAGGSYSVNGGAFTNSPGMVQSGDTVRVQFTASSSVKTTECTTLTIGGVSGQFCATTGSITAEQLLRILPMLMNDYLLFVP